MKSKKGGISFCSPKGIKMNLPINQKEFKIISGKQLYFLKLIVCPDCAGRGFIEEEYACGFKYPKCISCSGKGRLVEITTKKLKV